jgi:hypothetical protein
VAAVVLFLGALNATTYFLWNAHRLAPGELAAWALAIVALLWAVGRVCEPRPAAAARPTAG